MSSADEMRSQPGNHAADAADDDIVVADEETAIKGPGGVPWAPDGESSSAAAAGTEPGQAAPTAGGEPGSMPASAADEGNGASPMRAGQSRTTLSGADPGPWTGPPTGASAARQSAGASPGADDASSLGSTDLWTPPPSTGAGAGAGSQATGGAPSMSARSSRTGPSALRDDRRWREIQGMFVDDPRDSVQRASDLIDTAIEEFLAEIRQRQAALASSWQTRDADTEALRIALKDYRALWAVVRDMPAVSAPGGGAAASAGTGGSSYGAGSGGSAGQHEPEPGRTPA